MQPAASVDELVADPVGRSLSGRTWLYWWAEPALCGFALWGRPDESDTRQLIRALEAEIQPGAPRHASLVDARRLEGVDAAGFALLAEYLRPRWDALARKVERQALLRPSGLPGAVVAGFYEVLAPTYPTRAFAEPAEALRWLERGGPELVGELDALVSAAMGTPPVVRALREHLGGNLAGASLAAAARALGVSERNLQRRLRDAGTTFQAELNAAQVRAAQALLIDTDEKLTAVALEVGCASLQHFSGLFKKLTGESPSAWRRRRRGG